MKKKCKSLICAHVVPPVYSEILYIKTYLKGYDFGLKYQRTLSRINNIQVDIRTFSWCTTIFEIH